MGFTKGVGVLMQFILVVYFVFGFVKLSCPAKPKGDFIHKVTDAKDFKKFIRTHKNVLVVFSKTAKDFRNQDVFNDAAEAVKGLASIVHIDCSVDKKLCKKLKTSPSTVEYKHFKDGEYHKVYDRKVVAKSLVKFLQNPTGEIPWDEEADALDVVHLEKRSELSKLLTKDKKPVLVMFYAPWCGFCKKLKPDFAAAASALKGEATLAGMDVDTNDNAPIRMEFNITGFPTIIYFKNGQKQFTYGGENTKEGIIKWMKDPSPPKAPEVEKEWSEVESDVVHLTDESFDDIIKETPTALVMFYAPWCGHCKKMKPEYQEAATVMKDEQIPGILGAVDATKHPKLAERFAIKGYPTVKFFRDGKEEFDTFERTKDAIVSFMKDPKEPPPPPPADQSWDEIPSFVEHLSEETFKNYIKKKKHCLVIFYAPWCGHCKKAKPEFMAAAEELKDDSRVAFAAVDCTKYAQLCQTSGVTGYPTFKYFNYGKNDQAYSGGREKIDFVNFIRDPFGALSTKTPVQKSLSLHWDDLPGHEIITILNSESFDSFIEQQNLAIVTFYGSSCQHCHAMRQDFIDAAVDLKEQKVDVSFAAVDAVSERTLLTRFAILGLPSIRIFRNGKQLLEFEGTRTKENFIELAKNPPPLVVPFLEYESASIVQISSSENFQKLLSTTDRLLVFFYDSSNPRCSAARPAFWKAAENLPSLESEKYQFAALNCVEHQTICKQHSISDYPTFVLYMEGKFNSNFNSATTPMTEENFMSFFFQAPAKDSKKWEKESVKIEL